MFVCFFILICTAISPAVGSVVRSIASNQSCRGSQFTCRDGSCISADLVCDTLLDCSDGSDEYFCPSRPANETTKEVILGRFKRKSPCRREEWTCKDGTCIPIYEKCDGPKNCPDGSDETHAQCRHTQCLPHLFRCTYGACVDGTAACDDKVDCADRSDELIPRCRGEEKLSIKDFECRDGFTRVPTVDLCDGIPNCPDGSDETINVCGEHKCLGILFQCAYGACVDGNSDCNGVKDCADGSDEAEDLCNGTSPSPLSIPSVPTRINVEQYQPGNCELPKYPQFGNYTVTSAPNARPGDRLQHVRLVIHCHEGYGGIEKPEVFCHDGSWSVVPFPKCLRLCKLNKHPSVRYICHVTTNGIEVKRPCKAEEPAGTVVTSECNPYYYATTLPLMKCENGEWNRKVICQINCGRMTPDGEGLISGGTTAFRGQLPWHVGIYFKLNGSYEQICGGSLISNTVVLTAAHCFWDDRNKKKSDPSLFAVAAAKLYRDWDHPNDTHVQKSNVKAYDTPPFFLGGDTNFQLDIAAVILETPVVYHSYLLPVCLSFNKEFYKLQIRVPAKGKVAGWGLTGAVGRYADTLQVVDLPYVPEDQCVERLPLSFRQSITGDKICAGYDNGTSVCRGDSGGGLVFPDTEGSIQRFYLRGIVSSAPVPSVSGISCNTMSVTTFTNILDHEIFINYHL